MRLRPYQPFILSRNGICLLQSVSFFKDFRRSERRVDPRLIGVEDTQKTDRRLLIC
ncbi:MAG: hypothetical protein AAF741_17065 [Bacteroidota bacterium]